MKIDLHVHSGFSRRPSQWVLQKIGCPESFIEPLQIYRIARKRGMSLVTITDHNTINRITSYNVCYTKLLRLALEYLPGRVQGFGRVHTFRHIHAQLAAEGRRSGHFAA